MKYWFVVLTTVAVLAIVLSSLPPVAAQSSPLQELQITITDYQAEKVMPGSTFKVEFTVHKPAGMKVTDSMLTAYAYYYTDNKPVPVYDRYYGGGFKTFALPSLDEQDVNQELVVKILENAPVDQLIYIEVKWHIADVNVSISENENRITVTSGENTFTAPIVYTSVRADHTRYYVVHGFTNWVAVRSDRPDRLYVINRIGNVKILPRPLGVLYIVVAIVGVVIPCVVIGIALYYRKKLVSKEEILTGPE